MSEPVARRGLRRQAAVLALVAVLVAACGGAPSPSPTIPAGAIVVHAKDRAFDTKALQVHAGIEFPLVFVNEDGDLHNIAIRTQSGSGGDLLFRFDAVSTKTVVLTVSIPKGNWFFLCEVHPDMWGTVFAY
jgi:plastocyanin